MYTCTGMQRKKRSKYSHLKPRRKCEKVTHTLTVTTKLAVIGNKISVREHQKEGLRQTCSKKKHALQSHSPGGSLQLASPEVFSVSATCCSCASCSSSIFLSSTSAPVPIRHQEEQTKIGQKTV